jgi:hypothetical protein
MGLLGRMMNACRRSATRREQQKNEAALDAYARERNDRERGRDAVPPYPPEHPAREQGAFIPPP